MHTVLQPGMQIYPWPGCPFMMQGQYPTLPYMAGLYMLPGQYTMAGPYEGGPGPAGAQRDSEVQGSAETDSKMEESSQNPYAVPEQYRVSPLLAPLLLAPFFIRPYPPPPPPFYYYYNYYYVR